MNIPSTIAIDGPVASGKTTLARALARKLGYLYLDTGMMYRAVTWCALTRGISIDDEAAVVALASALVLDIESASNEHGCSVYADGQDITPYLREPEVDRNVSPVSAYAGVREALTRQQRHIGERGRVVMVGRDIGTVVLPDAELKIYLDASTETRAMRRWRELGETGNERDYDEILAETQARDTIDSGRLVAPLCPASDAVVIDTTPLNAQQVLERVLALIDMRRQGTAAGA